MAPLVRVEDAGDGVAVLTLDRPERRNALSIALRDEMSDALDALGIDPAVRTLVVTGAGDVFSAGFDLEEFGRLDDADHAARLWASSDRWHATILRFPLPVVAAVNGAAYGGGFDLAVMCDLRVAARTARFAHPEHVFSQVVYGPLHDLVGGAVARDLALTGRVVEAEEAQALGLVSRVVPGEQLLAEARRDRGGDRARTAWRARADEAEDRPSRRHRHRPDARPVSEGRLLTARFVLVVTAGLSYFTGLGMLLPVVPVYVEHRLGGGGFAVGVAVGRAVRERGRLPAHRRAVR